MRRFIPSLALSIAATVVAVVAVVFVLSYPKYQGHLWDDETVRLIVKTAQESPDTNVAHEIELRFGAKNVSLTPMWSLSDPPKLQLSFTLDGIYHSIRIEHTALLVPDLSPTQPSRGDGK